MTQGIIDNKAVPERPNDTIKLPTTLEKYLEELFSAENPRPHKVLNR